MKPWWKQRTVWATALGVALALPGLVADPHINAALETILGADAVKRLAAAGIILAAVGSVLARAGAVSEATAQGAPKEQ